MCYGPIGSSMLWRSLWSLDIVLLATLWQQTNRKNKMGDKERVPKENISASKLLQGRYRREQMPHGPRGPNRFSNYEIDGGPNAQGAGPSRSGPQPIDFVSSESIGSPGPMEICLRIVVLAKVCLWRFVPRRPFAPPCASKETHTTI